MNFDKGGVLTIAWMPWGREEQLEFESFSCRTQSNVWGDKNG